MEGAAILMVLFERLLPVRERPDRTPIVQYALVAVLETVGFAFFFDDELDFREKESAW